MTYNILTAEEAAKMSEEALPDIIEREVKKIEMQILENIRLGLRHWSGYVRKEIHSQVSNALVEAKYDVSGDYQNNLYIKW